MSIVYLRLFKNHRRQGTFMQGAWREFGPVSMLRSADSLTIDEVKFARSSGGLARLLTSSDDHLERTLEMSAPGRLERGWHFVEVGISRVLVRDKYGAYPLRAMLCSDGMWKRAVNRLIDQADLVALDLSGFRSEKHVGTRYELQTVFDRVPVERLILLADPVSNFKLLERAITDAWSGMAADSPNAQRRGIEIWAAQVDIIQQRQNQDGSQQSWSLIARRPQTRELLTLIQRLRLPAAPPIVPQGQLTHSTAATGVPRPSSVEPSIKVPVVDEPIAAAKRPVGRRLLRIGWLAAALLVGTAVVSFLVWGRRPPATSLVVTTSGGLDVVLSPPAQVDLQPCAGWIIQAGAFASQRAAEDRARDVAELWPTIGNGQPVGWVRGTDCEMSPMRPDYYFAIVGPFGTKGEASLYCVVLRREELANVDHMSWADNSEELAGYRKIGGDFTDC